jgi:glutamate/tyrosine decarboxylase-like PLP-dependent enzyme
MNTSEHPDFGPEQTLDPADWSEFRAQAHRMLDAAVDRMERYRDGPVWTPLPPALQQNYQGPLPSAGIGPKATQTHMAALLPYGVGNTHPRFFGWVHGSGTPGNLMADITAAAMNANLGGRDHGAMYVEKQVVNWCRELFEFPATSSGLIVSGTSIATVIALKAARDRCFDFSCRKTGLQKTSLGQLVGYTSAQTHSCVARAFDILGLGSDSLRKVAVNERFEIDTGALTTAIAQDRAAGLTPFVIVGTAGAVNVGAIDDLESLADIAQTEQLWLHIDGAFGALGVLSERLRPRLTGLRRADSLAFDFHKWLHVNYDAGFILMRSEELHRRAFSERPEYLKGAERGLAAGNPWPVEYGPELSRGFRALKVWAQLAEHGTVKLGALITQNCEQAAYLEGLVRAHPQMTVVAPVAMNICCFSYQVQGQDIKTTDALNDEIVVQLQLQGIAAPSTTLVNGRTAIRVNITNHRTTRADLDLLVSAVERIALQLLATVDKFQVVQGVCARQWPAARPAGAGNFE